MKTQRKGSSNVSKQFDVFIKDTAENVCKSVLRAYKREKRREDNLRVQLECLEEVAVTNPVPDYEKIEVKLGESVIYIDNERLAKALSRLKTSYQIILENAILKEMSNKAIAELMELEEKTIRNYKSEALMILRNYLEEDQGVE